MGSKETTIKVKPKKPKPVARFELGLLGKKSVALPLAHQRGDNVTVNILLVLSL